ncbi:Alpha/Beta hydrolase protein [Aspergillus oleicola]
MINLLFILILTGSRCTMAEKSTHPRSSPRSNYTYTYTPPWCSLPPTPLLPPSSHEGHVQINNVSLWYALYGAPLHATITTTTNTSTANDNKSPIVLLHGGKISSRWFSHLITSLIPFHSVIALDTRGHGRSTDDTSRPLSYTLFANDAIAVLDFLKVQEASFVGWSDGANTALQIAMGFPGRVDRVIVYGANYSPNQVNRAGLAGVPFGEELVERERKEYMSLNPKPDWELFSARVEGMQAVEPVWTKSDFERIPTLDEDDDAPMILVAAGDHEEAIFRDVPGRIFEMVSEYISRLISLL